MRSAWLEPSERSWLATLALRVHALVDRFAHFLRQVDALQAHVDDFDPDSASRPGWRARVRLHDHVAILRYDFVHRALAEFLAQRRVDGLRNARLRLHLVADAHVVLARVVDPPFHERIHQQVLLLRGDIALGVRRIQRENARSRSSARSG